MEGRFFAGRWGVILHTGVHMFDLLRYLSGDEVRRVYCETDRIFYEELEDMFVATLRMRRSKIRCVIDAARYTGTFRAHRNRRRAGAAHGRSCPWLWHDHSWPEGDALDIAPPVNTVEQALRPSCTPSSMTKHRR